MRALIAMIVAAILPWDAGLHASARQSIASSRVSLVLLLDVSASVDFRTLELPFDHSEEIEAALLARLGPGDAFGVGAFGDTLKFSGFLPDDGKSRAAAVRAAFKNRSVGLNGASRIWDAVDEAIVALEAMPDRRAIILLTDGQASGNRWGVDAVIAHARRAQVAVSVIGSGGWVLSTRVPRSGPTPRTALEELTTGTGGQLVLDNAGDKFRHRRPGRFFAELLAGFRAAARLATSSPVSAR